MTALRIYVPGDAAAVACGADEVAAARRGERSQTRT